MESVDGRDRLSEMPDEVIIHILSCMPIVYAVRTMLLCRFGDLWTWVHTLKLDMDEKMLVFFRNVLILHKRPSINIFDIRVEYNSSDECACGEAKTWVRFALDKQAKELILCDMSDCEFSTNLLVHNFSSQYLVKLVLDSCNLETQFEVNLPSLKKLSMDNCVIYDEELLSFLCGCPSLQELEIEDLYYLDKLSISAPNIDKLSLVCDDCEPLPFDCPNLKTLELDVSDHGIVITNISSVRNIYVKNYPGNSNNDKLHTTRKLFYGKLDGVEVLHLSRYVSHEFLDTVQHLDLLQYKWKRVVLELRKLDQVCLVGIYHLMRSLSNFEELTIYTELDFEASTDLPLLEVPPPYVSPQLKTFTMHGCGKTWKSQLRLVEFLLKGAAVLDKLIIITTKHQRPYWNAKPAEELEFAKLVSSFPRASTSARVLFA